jgi:hypothetical protein
MYDMLTELKALSLELQSRDLTIPDANRKMVLQRQVFVSLKNQPGKFETKAMEGIEDEVFRGVKVISSARGMQKIKREQFIQALIDSFDSRMFSDKSLLEDLQVLDERTWPSDVSASVTFADAAVERLNDRLFIGDPDLCRKFREYVSGGARDKSLIKSLLDAISLIPTNTAECERGFHAMNLLMDSLRTSLDVSTLTEQLFIYVTGPPLELFKPEAYVESWLRQGRNTAVEAFAMAKKKADYSSAYHFPLWQSLP